MKNILKTITIKRGNKFGILLLGVDVLILVVIIIYFVIQHQNNCLSEAQILSKSKVLAPCIRNEVLPPSGFQTK